MRLTIFLDKTNGDTIPINYQYPLSAAIYQIIAKGDKDYASFLHEKGYGKGFKFFTFSQINVPFKIEGDRMRLMSNELKFPGGFSFTTGDGNFCERPFSIRKNGYSRCKIKSRLHYKISGKLTGCFAGV